MEGGKTSVISRFVCNGEVGMGNEKSGIRACAMEEQHEISTVC